MQAINGQLFSGHRGRDFQGCRRGILGTDNTIASVGRKVALEAGKQDME